MHSHIMLRYLVTALMGADLNNIIKFQSLSDDHVQFLVYQILRGLKVSRIASAFFTYLFGSITAHINKHVP